MHSTNLLNMMDDPYLEDWQLAAPKEIVNLVERFENLNLDFYESKKHMYIIGIFILLLLLWTDVASVKGFQPLG